MIKDPPGENLSYSSFDSEPNYVSQENGWRVLFVSLVIAAILGMSFRLYFSPNRIKGWIEAELKRQPAKIELNFKSAELRLARGLIPQLAIRLTDVEGRAAKSCARGPGFRISEIFIPFRMVPLFGGRVAVGTVHGEALEVDLDALRDRCEGTSEASLAAAAAENVRAKVVPLASQSSAESPSAPARPWWTPDQLQTVKNLVSGMSFVSVSLYFERRSKYVIFEDLAVRADVAPDSVFVSTDVRVPPPLLFGEQFPPFSLEATVKNDAADVELKGSWAEGNLNGLATLKAVPGDVAIDAHLQAVSVPLSALLPFAKRGGWLKQELQPKFVWLHCEASVKGEVRRLFREHPIAIEKCTLEGESGRVSVAKALIGPGAKFDPFEIVLTSVDVERWLDMFGKKGPKGIMSKFGRLSGRVDVRTPDDIEFDGALLDAQIRFSRRAVRMQQGVPEIRGKIVRKNERLSLVVNEVQFNGGKFGGQISLDADRDLKAGQLNVAIQDLRLHPDVEQLLMGGGWQSFSLKGRGDLTDGQMASFKGEVSARGVTGRDLRMDLFEARVSVDGAQAKLETSVVAGAARNGSSMLEAISPIFLGHKFTDEWVPFRDARVQFYLENRDLRWEKASLLLRNGQIWLTSSGTNRDDGSVTGWLSVDYPKVKKLRWDLSGKSTSPRLEPNERTLQETRGREMNDAALGIFVPAAKVRATAETNSEPAKETGFRQLREKVFEKAKSILPKMESKVSGEASP